MGDEKRMVELRLVGLSEDRRHLVFAGPSGQEFTVPVDERLRAALRGDRARLGQLEIQMDSALRPRDIQARIRAGESPEAVAQVAQVPVEKIMGYAVPVLAEREHMAERARRATVRRKGGDGPGRVLGDAVAERLRRSNVDPDSASWDACRRDDGKWTVTVTHGARGKGTAASFVFDPLGRYALPDDDGARWLVGEQTAEGPERGGTRPGRRLAAVSDPAPEHRTGADDKSLPFGDEELTAVADAVAASPAAGAPSDTAQQDAEQQDAAQQDAAQEDAEHDIRQDADRDSAEQAQRGGPAASEDEEEESDTPRRRRRGARGRASVPSWDEIMFGRTKE